MKKQITKTFFLLIFFSGIFGLAKNSEAKDLFVATNGSDSVTYESNDISHPWLTPQKAWYSAKAGDTVYFRGGTYNVSSTINTKFNGSSGTSAAPIRFTRYGTENVTIAGSVVPMFSIQKAYNYVSYINFTGPGTCFELGEDNAGQNFHADHCTYSMSTGGDNNGFIYGWPGGRSNGLEVTNCTIHGPSNYASIHQNSNGIVLFSLSTVKIENNEIYNVPIGIYFKHGNSSGGSGIQINKNYIHHTNRYGIEINSLGGTYSNNVFGPSSAGIRINEENGGPVGDSNIISHNTLSGSAGIVLSTDDDGANNNTITDNIFASRTTCCSGNNWDYNLYVSGAAIGSHDISNHSPTYAGGVSPATVNGFALAAGSFGKGAASEGNGKDIGADVSLVGPDGEVSSPSCTENWTCSSWSTCSNSSQTRTCTDSNSCGTTASKPATTQSCTSSTPASENECTNWQTNHPDWIFCDDFESTASIVSPSRYFDYDNDGGDFVPVDGVGFNSSKGMRALFQQGEVGAGAMNLAIGDNPAASNTVGGTNKYRDIYYRQYLKLDPNWSGADPAKLSRATILTASDWSQAMVAHLWSDPGSASKLMLDPASCVSGGTVQCVGYNDSAHTQWLGAVNGTTPIYNGSYNDQWLCIEHHVKLNDSGQSNGIQEFWINGNLEARKTGINFVGTYSTYGINSIFFENYWNTGSTRLQTRVMDNIVVSTQPIGCVEASSDTTPPASPVGLTVI